MEKPPEVEPVQGSGDDAMAKKTCMAKRLTLWGTFWGESE